MSWLQWLAWAILGSLALPMAAASANGQLITDPNVCKIVAGANTAAAKNKAFKLKYLNMIHALARSAREKVWVVV
jgi:hypothetical protein